MTVTIDGEVSIVEKAHGKTLWVAYVLKGAPWKIILKGQKAEDSLREIISGSKIIASGSTVKFDGGIFKLFADCYMKFTEAHPRIAS